MIHVKDRQADVEAIVNSPEVLDLAGNESLPFEQIWTATLHQIEKKLEADIFPSDQAALHDDLRDWWKNGNWGNDGYWNFGEGPFWRMDGMPR